MKKREVCEIIQKKEFTSLVSNREFLEKKKLSYNEAREGGKKSEGCVWEKERMEGRGSK